MTTTNGTDPRTKLRDLRQRQRLLEAELRVSHLERLRTRQKRSAEVRESMEAWEWINGFNDVVDRLRGPDRDLVLPVSTALDRRYGANWPFWRTWLEHARLRAAARLLWTMSGLAQGGLKGLTSYVIGSGMTMDAGARKKKSPAPVLLEAVQDFLDDFYEANNFAAWQREMFVCSRRDGEYFARHFVQDDGMTLLRVVLPEQVVEPPAYDPQEWSFGVRNDLDDLQQLLAFWVAYDGMADHGREVPIDGGDDCNGLDYLRLNVDAPVKRGLSDLCFDTYENIKAAGRMVQNMGEGGAVQAAIAFIRQHEAATSSQVSDFLASTADYQETNPRNLAQQNVLQTYPGQVVDIDKGQEYVVPPFASNASGFAEVANLVLGVVAVRWNAPKWLFSNDTDLNYASSLTAESPFVKTCKAEQDTCYKPYFLALVKRALKAYCERGKLRAGGHVFSWDEVRREVEVQCEAPTIETRNKLEEAQTHSVYLQAQVESVQTVQQQLGLDPDQERQNIEEQQGRMGATGQPLPDDPEAAGEGGGLADLLRGVQPPRPAARPTEEGEERRPFDASALLEAERKGGQFAPGGGRVAAKAKHDEAKGKHREAAKAHKAAEKALTKHEARLGKSAEAVQQAEVAHKEAKKALAAAKRAARKKTAGKAEAKAVAKAEKSTLAAKAKLDKLKAAHREHRKTHTALRREHGKAGKAAQKALEKLAAAKAALDAAKAAKPARAKPGARKPVAAKPAMSTKTQAGGVEQATGDLTTFQHAMLNPEVRPEDIAPTVRGIMGGLSAKDAVAAARALGVHQPKTKGQAVEAVAKRLETIKGNWTRTTMDRHSGKAVKPPDESLAAKDAGLELVARHAGKAAKPAAFDPAGHTQAVADVVKDLGGPNNFASIADVRDKLAKDGIADRGHQDQAILAAWRAGLITGSAGEWGAHKGGAKTQREMDAGLQLRGESPIDFLSIKPAAKKPAAPAAMPPAAARAAAGAADATKPLAERLKSAAGLDTAVADVVYNQGAGRRGSVSQNEYLRTAHNAVAEYQRGLRRPGDQARLKGLLDESERGIREELVPALRKLAAEGQPIKWQFTELTPEHMRAAADWYATEGVGLLDAARKELRPG